MSYINFFDRSEKEKSLPLQFNRAIGRKVNGLIISLLLHLVLLGKWTGCALAGPSYYDGASW